MDKEVAFPINEGLLKEASRIKEEIALVKERLAKIDASKGSVSESVYEKVKGDYTKKLGEVTDQLMAKKADVDRELGSLYETRNKIMEQVGQHKDALEEVKFRHSIGETSEEEFHKSSEEAASKIAKFEKILTSVNANVSKYEAIFEERPEEVSPRRPKKPGRPERPAAPVEGAEEYPFIPQEGQDYFSPEAQPEVDTTEVTAERAEPHEPAKLVIIKGDHLGKEFVLRGDTSIGRAGNNDIVVKDAKVSRQHATVKLKGKEYVIIDLNSSNGIFVNGERVKEHVLTEGDQVGIGDFVLEFRK